MVFDGCRRRQSPLCRNEFALNLLKLFETNIGRAAARNKGLENTGDVIIFVDDDRTCSGLCLQTGRHEEECVLGERMEQNLQSPPSNNCTKMTFLRL